MGYDRLILWGAARRDPGRNYVRALIVTRVVAKGECVTAMIRYLALVCAALIAAGPARALDPARSIAQYKHTRWTIDEGAPVPIKALAPGKDGYLWVSGKQGLYRFDGIRFELITSPNAGRAIYTLLVTRKGDVWVGYKGAGTAVYHRGTFTEVPMPDAGFVKEMVETPDGSIWATLGRKEHQLYRFRDGAWAEIGSRLGFPASDMVKMIVTRNGTVMISTIRDGIYALLPGAARFVRTSDVLVGHAALSEDRNDNVWISDASGSRVSQFGRPAVNAQAVLSYPTPEARRDAEAFFDRDNNMWGKTEDSIFRLRQPQPGGAASQAGAIDSVAQFQAADGLLTGNVRGIAEDREGNIWVATVSGLERFRAANIVVEPKLTNRAFWHDVLLAASDGSVYIGESDAVYRVRPGGAVQRVMPAKETLALCEGPDQAIWAVMEGRVARLDGDRISRFPSPVEGLAINDCAVDIRNQLWISADDGLFRQVSGVWQKSPVPPETNTSLGLTLLRLRDGRMLAADETLAIVDPPAPARPLISADRRFNPVRLVFETPERLLFGGNFGIGALKDGQLRLLSSKRFPVLNNTGGIATTSTGQTWVVSAAGTLVIRTDAFDRALTDPKAPLPVRIFDFRDGLPGLAGGSDRRAVVGGGDGRMWLTIGTGTVWIDSRHLHRNIFVPPVNISALIADGKTVRDPVAVPLQAGSQNIEIDFSVLSLSIPERVQARYQLVGDGQGWIDPGMRRQVFYTNLGPGHYVFKVIGANDDGVWNRTGATLAFDIPPTFLQSKWFLALCIAGIGLLLWIAYRIRVRQLTGKMRERLEQRLAERERIARDLHDTLLQGFQGLILRFQSVANDLSGDQRAQRSLNAALDAADTVLREGRDSVRLLRTVDSSDLAQTLSETAARMSASYPVDFNMVVEGRPRALHPVVGGEICRIGEEAIINAFQHARASLIEVALTYGATDLTLGIRDNGVGIDAAILDKGGRQGHFGLVGMQERATQIEADLNVSSRAGAGTEINLTVPGKIAYVSQYRRWWQPWQWLLGSARGLQS